MSDMDFIDVDYSKLEANVAQEASRSKAGSRLSFWKPKLGDNRIHVLPPWTDKGPNAFLFYRKVGQHFKFGVDPEKTWPVLCKQVTPYEGEKQPCCACAASAILRRSSNVEDRDLSNDWRVKHSYHALIIDDDDPVYTHADVEEWKKGSKGQDGGGGEPPFKLGSPKVQIWAFGVKMLEDLKQHSQKGKVRFWHPHEGHAILINRTGSGMKDTKYLVTVEFDKTPLPLPKGVSYKDVKLDLEALETFPSDEEVLERLDEDLAAQVQERVKALSAGGSGKLLRSGAARDSEEVPFGAKDEEPEDVFDDEPLSARGGQRELEKNVEPQPECYADPKIHSDRDPECVGGKIGKDAIVERCPYFDGCAEEVAAKLAPPAQRRRAAGDGKPTSAAALAAEIRAAIGEK